jgi:hypothetical protein
MNPPLRQQRQTATKENGNVAAEKAEAKKNFNPENTLSLKRILYSNNCYNKYFFPIYL